MKHTPHPIVSVIVLVGPKKSATLDLCVGSVRRSSYRRYELLLIVNSSSRTYLSYLRARHPAARVVSMGKNVGISGLNKGIDMSRGRYVFFLDEDCEIEKDGLKMLVQRFQREPMNVAAIAGNVYNMNQKSYFWKRVPWLSGHSLFTFPGGATAFRKESFRAVGGFDEDFFLWLHEDDLALRLLGKGHQILFDPAVRVLHRDQELHFRPFQAYTIFRNKAWLNAKYFSCGLFPLITLRDLVWITSFALYKRTLLALFWAIAGYAVGYATAGQMKKKRSRLPLALQWKFLRAYFRYTNR